MKCTGLAAAAMAAGSLSAAEQNKKPNIIFVLADDLGYGELGCFGQKKIKTPNIDQLAQDGMKFTQFYSGQTVCAPSRCSFLTGKHMGHAFIRDNSGSKGKSASKFKPLPPSSESGELNGT